MFSNMSKFYAFLMILQVYTQVAHSFLYWHHGWDENYNSSIPLSSPEECARDCQDDEPPKNCYYSFHIEFYTTVGPACDSKEFQSQCIYADGLEKTLIPINRQLPGPKIEVCVNDRIIVDVNNAAPGLEITLHWHGIFQNGFQYYDGVPYVTQCPIPSSTTFRYDFVVENSGTHFYHSHMSTHMLDGQYGALIVKDPPSKDPHRDEYDDELIIFLSDWTHELSMERYPGWYRHDVGQTAKNILINGLGNWTDPDTQQTTNGSLTVFTVQKGKRYRLRIINSFSTVCLAELSFENHTCGVIAQDGANVKMKTVSKLISAAGERVDCILNANQSASAYWIQVRGLGECRDKRVQQLAILRYENGPVRPPSPPPSYDNNAAGIVYNPLNSTNCNTNDTTTSVCVNQVQSVKRDTELLKVEPDERHVLPFWFYNYTQYGDRTLFSANTYKTFFDATDYSQLISTFNEIAYENSASPLLSQTSSYQTVCKKNQLSNCVQPCTCAQVISVKLGNVVELVIYDAVPLTDLHHPFHLHGYEFNVFSVGQFNDNRNISRDDINEVIQIHTERLRRGEYKNPPGKDTVKIPMGGYAIIRFKADNPGWWLLHCHFSWHHITGMELVIRVGDDYDMPPVPRDFPKCNNWKPALHTLNDFYGFRYPKPY
ncbi:Laccase-1 [Habropoda laboriosa]|uniref:Laccase-1 n=1 Tax=Habropoda laboriosa TaxID=597456 RepID=A0A0L7QLI3_9HYME|nr:PREDICTED: laccase-2-like [Habropoda laboriosa]KOC59409.1 Laccase-1 [Habropoda laboriosa]